MEIKNKWITVKNLMLKMSVVIISVVLSPINGVCDQTYVTIGTGSINGIYYLTGGAIIRIFNQKSAIYNIRSIVETTNGSVYNINAVLKGDIEFGIVQSDRQYQAYNGLADWQQQGPQKNLRSVFSIHPEAITLIASASSGITTITSLIGKRLNIGHVNSGQRLNAIHALQHAGLNWEKDIKVIQTESYQSPQLLQAERIDAFFYTAGHPNAIVKETLTLSPGCRFIPIQGVQALIEKYPYYIETEIPTSFYPEYAIKETIPTFGVMATFITSAGVPDDVVFAITKEVFENFEVLKSLHPAYAVLSKKSMFEALSAPIHPGAMRYYESVKMIPKVKSLSKMQSKYSK